MEVFSLERIAEELKKTEGRQRITLCFHNGELYLVKREDIAVSDYRFWGEVSFDIVDGGLINITKKEMLRP
uniref:Uncharacterized protein n=1 Tax=viral metagenome TaxID=1070528 RepID=A0A6M3LEL0_9ZZZZ